ncbi:MAG TPA: polysaccharide deacetylase family protein [Casimicrobiaceae bacterium]|nr:polysaccharide deacetylase family protein [Casimicrobiaceae bacterium]
MRAHVLTYHSHHVVGETYSRNDHVALKVDLDLITDLGCEIVSLSEVVDELTQGARGGHDESVKVAITFDDGPIYDVDAFTHPTFGPQRGFLGIMRDFVAKRGVRTQPSLCATSFVIASPDARRVIESTYDAEYTFVGPGAMTDDWWNRAIDSGLISIANHSWDHLHPALRTVAHSRQAKGDFRQVTTAEDADAQIRNAGIAIAARTNGRHAPYFAFPFGQYNAFLVGEYLPSNSERIGLRAAFTDEPKMITGHESQWCLPRYICGHHWKSPSALASILET